MSHIEDLSAITTPSLTDLLYIYQNGDDFKITNQQLLDLIKTNTVIPLTQAQYNALTPAEQNNGSIYVIRDANITAQDVEYSSGVSVKDKLDELDKSATQTITYNGVPFVFTRKGHIVMVSVSHNSQVAFSNAWTNLGTLNDDLKPSGYTFCGMIFPAGHFLQLRIIPTTGVVDIASDSAANMYPQGSTTYLV